MDLMLTRKHAWRSIQVLLLALLPVPVSAQLLNRIEVYKENNIGVVHVLLNRPVIYTHHFPPEHGYLVHIYFSDQRLDRNNWGAAIHGAVLPNDEFMRAPPNDIVPVFWVSYNNHGTGDLILDPFHLIVQFSQPVHYKIMTDADNQGFYIFVLSTDAPATKAPPADAAKEQTKKPAEPAPIRLEPADAKLP